MYPKKQTAISINVRYDSLRTIPPLSPKFSNWRFIWGYVLLWLIFHTQFSWNSISFWWYSSIGIPSYFHLIIALHVTQCRIISHIEHCSLARVNSLVFCCSFLCVSIIQSFSRSFCRDILRFHSFHLSTDCHSPIVITHLDTTFSLTISNQSEYLTGKTITCHISHHQAFF